MAAPKPLCAYCLKIPLDPEVLNRLPKRERIYPLGTLHRVRTSDCPLCRLVSLCQHKYSRCHGPLYADTEISLAWEPGIFRLLAPYSFAFDMGICFLADPRLSVDAGNQYSRCLSPSLGQALDLERVRKWVACCEQQHGQNCKGGGADVGAGVADCYPGLNFLRFVDVQESCIVEMQAACRYVALSYVWGLAASLRLSTVNRADLMRPGALREHALAIPLTICDAVAFVRGIGERYLWVDALCLVQNDPDDVRRGVDTMDLIYERALLTVVAARGHDANAGLPGVEEGTRFMLYPEEIIPGVRLDAFISLEALLADAVHSTRAWTFQEIMLSRRIVYFVDNQVFFRCRENTISERFHPILDERNDVISESRLGLPTPKVFMPVVDYKVLVTCYSKRVLTHQADVLRAFAGIVRRYSDKMKCRFLEGLPTASLDMFLVFYADRCPLNRRHGFPSYSWAGWRGSVTFVGSHVINVIKKDGLRNSTWISTWIAWYERSPRGVVRLVWDPAEDGAEDWAADGAFPFHDDHCAGRRSPARPPVALPFPTTRTQPTETVVPAALRSYPILQFWTLAAFFTVDTTDSILGMARVQDRDGAVCGALYLDGLEDSTFFQGGFRGRGPFEMIALSETVAGEWTMFTGLPRVVRQATNVFNVMVLEWAGGVAERRAIGYVRRSAFTRSLDPGPAWKEILLG